MAWTMGVVGIAGIVVVGVLGLSGLVLAASAIRWASARPPTMLAVVGAALVAIGYAPYLLVQKLPTFENWESRHQLLLPFGIAALVVSALILLGDFAPRRLARGVTVVLIAVLAVTAAAAPISLAVDWRKQEQLIALLRESPQIESARTVQFTDLATSWNFGSRTYRFYEYTAFLRAAYGGETRLGGEEQEVALAVEGDFHPLQVNPDMYGVADWKSDGKRTLVVIAPRENANAWGLLFGQPSMELRITTEG